MNFYLWTGQSCCYDINGNVVPCENTGQDAEFGTGIAWPGERFSTAGELVHDNLTGLVWLKNANPAEFPIAWQEALAYVSGMNRDKTAGRSDWRLPNRRELRSLLAFETRKPALPFDHPFENVFLGWYWTGTTAAIQPAYAWYVHMEGGRMFFGRKDQYCLAWPVSGPGEGILAQTGQRKCYGAGGNSVPCSGTGQDGELRKGVPWPEPRFSVRKNLVEDRLTGLFWLKDADVNSGTLNWSEALDFIHDFAQPLPDPAMRWRLPTINELESLVDCSRHSPALPEGHPFENVRDVYWASTTSYFEPDWAWALYLNKGATGVGFKQDKTFHLWPVASKTDR